MPLLSTLVGLPSRLPWKLTCVENEFILMGSLSESGGDGGVGRTQFPAAHPGNLKFVLCLSKQVMSRGLTRN